MHRKLQFPKHIIFVFLGICFASVILCPDSVSWDPSAVLQGQFKFWLGFSAIFATVTLKTFSTSFENCSVCWQWPPNYLGIVCDFSFFCNKASSYSMLSHTMPGNIHCIPVTTWRSPEYWHCKGYPGSVALSFSQRCRNVNRVGKSAKILRCTLRSVTLEKRKEFQEWLVTFPWLFSILIFNINTAIP